ncbi:hypothetical protein BGX38DRAFT_1176593 [Terfezia claveryi]|nr:hypothetical protein BGX38DRAFT_1176593 [Terfezia claveryi]
MPYCHITPSKRFLKLYPSRSLLIAVGRLSFVFAATSCICPPGREGFSTSFSSVGCFFTHPKSFSLPYSAMMDTAEDLWSCILEYYNISIPDNT